MNVSCNKTTLSSTDNISTGAANCAWHDDNATVTSLTPLFIILALLSLGIMAANAFVVYLFRKKAFLKTATNTCLVSLAASDFLAGAVAIPMLIACNISETASEQICTAMDLSSRFISILTVLHLLVVTLERYLMIVHPMRYPLWITKPRVVGILIAIWIVSLVASLVQLGWIELDEQQSQHNDVIYDLILIGVVLSSLAGMAFAYALIFSALREQITRRNKLQLPAEAGCRRKNKPSERKAIMLFGFLILSFVVCWFPYFLDGLREDLDFIELVPVPFWAQVVIVFLRFCSALINPLVYTFFKRDFRKALFLITRRRSHSLR